MGKKKIKEFDLKKLLEWIDNDPHKEADLIEEVPVSASTLGRIKSGSYKPSELLGREIMAVIGRK